MIKDSDADNRPLHKAEQHAMSVSILITSGLRLSSSLNTECFVRGTFLPKIEDNT